MVIANVFSFVFFDGYRDFIGDTIDKSKSASQTRAVPQDSFLPIFPRITSTQDEKTIATTTNNPQ